MYPEVLGELGRVGDELGEWVLDEFSLIPYDRVNSLSY